MHIRYMIEEDIPQLSTLYEQFWGDKSDTEKMRTQYKKLLGAGTHIFLSAVDEGKLIGSVMGVICEELYGECRPFLVIENMIVDKNSRRTGAGRALLSELERRARERGCTQMILVTESNREDACGFYEALGFPKDKKKDIRRNFYSKRDWRDIYMLTETPDMTYNN